MRWVALVVLVGCGDDAQHVNPDTPPADTTPPVVTITGAPASPTNSADASLGVTCDEMPCTLACTMDTASVDCAHAVFAALPDGTHAFVATGTDGAGNIGMATASWVVDTTAPTTSFTQMPADPTNVTTGVHAFACDETCTFECRLDTAAFGACTSPVTSPSLVDGTHAVEVRAIDLAGNVGATASDGWTVDTVPPTTTITGTPVSPTNQATAMFTFTANEMATFECSRDGGAFAACSSPYMPAGFTTGLHELDVRAIDLAGNVGTAVAHMWTVDVTPPTTTITSSPLATTQYTTAAASFTCSETPCTFECSLDGAAFGACTSPASYAGLSSAAHSIAVRATDQVGNVGAPATANFTVDPTLDVIAVGSGIFHACAIRSNGTLWCWGYNAQHQVGDGTTSNRNRPAQIGTATNWMAVSGGINHTCALRTDGTAWCWGDNAYGQIGDGTISSTNDRLAPTRAGTATNYTRLATGDNFACALATDHTLWCWGENSIGQLGDGSTTNRSSPVQVGTDTDWDYPIAGGNHACAVKLDKTLWCWGHNGGDGVVGDGTTITRTSPVLILANVTAASAGSSYSCALQTNALSCWGNNFWGNLGDGTTTSHKTPNPVPGAWSAIFANSYHACAMKTDNTLWCWGNDNSGALGDGVFTATQVPTTTPQACVIGTGWTYVLDSNGNQSFGLRADGTLWAWGNNGQGSLGNGDNVPRNVANPTLL